MRPISLLKLSTVALATLALGIFACSEVETDASENGNQAQSRGGAGTAESGCTAPEGQAILIAQEESISKPATDAPEGESQECVTTFSYFQVMGLPEATQKKINSELKSNLKEVEKAKCGWGESLTTSASVSFNKDNLLSLASYSDYYMAGAAHPDAWAEYYNFDLATGARLQLADIIKPEGKAILRDAVLKRVDRIRIDDEHETELRSALVSAVNDLFDESSNSNTNFTLSDKGISFHLINKLPHAILALDPAKGIFVPYTAFSQYIKETAPALARKAAAVNSGL